jgi:hypothetical protein
MPDEMEEEEEEKEEEREGELHTNATERTRTRRPQPKTSTAKLHSPGLRRSRWRQQKKKLNRTLTVVLHSKIY